MISFAAILAALVLNVHNFPYPDPSFSYLFRMGVRVGPHSISYTENHIFNGGGGHFGYKDVAINFISFTILCWL